ncbi:hypothetical protein BpHYR1_029045 [Brachionus plicatilis]|uniref:Uncharacterized protein n=1 Tax=Brachionus plicatilis TaxID=10195 RepID=A0A3M7P5U5_BRAPC|nr:hypothetical protein BpHYR1_029045 [Brachionus plicatilis]
MWQAKFLSKIINLVLIKFEIIVAIIEKIFPDTITHFACQNFRKKMRQNCEPVILKPGFIQIWIETIPCISLFFINVQIKNLLASFDNLPSSSKKSCSIKLRQCNQIECLNPFHNKNSLDWNESVS